MSMLTSSLKACSQVPAHYSRAWPNMGHWVENRGWVLFWWWALFRETMVLLFLPPIGIIRYSKDDFAWRSAWMCEHLFEWLVVSFYVRLLPSTSEFPLCVCSLLSSMVLHTGYPFQTTCRKVTPDTSGRKSIRELKSMHLVTYYANLCRSWIHLTKQTHVHELKDFILHYYGCRLTTFPFFTVLRNHNYEY